MVLTGHASCSAEEDKVSNAADDICTLLELVAADSKRIADASQHLAAIVAANNLNVG